MKKPSFVTLVSGGSYAQREAAIAAAILTYPPAETKAVILEGLPDGTGMLLSDPSLQLHRIAPGCMCCIGNLVMRVTLNRLLRHPPERLYLSLASAGHLENIRHFFQQVPYSELLTVDQDVRI